MMYTRLASVIAVVVGTIAVGWFGISQSAVAGHPGHGQGHHCYKQGVRHGHHECPSPSPTTAGPTATVTVTVTPAPNDLNLIVGTRRANTLVGTDVLFGGRGRDRLNGGPGVDVLRGGRGLDTCVTDGLDRLVSCERVRVRS